MLRRANRITVFELINGRKRLRPVKFDQTSKVIKCEVEDMSIHTKQQDQFENRFTENSEMKQSITKLEETTISEKTNSSREHHMKDDQGDSSVTTTNQDLKIDVNKGQIPSTKVKFNTDEATASEVLTETQHTDDSKIEVTKLNNENPYATIRKTKRKIAKIPPPIRQTSDEKLSTRFTTAEPPETSHYALMSPKNPIDITPNPTEKPNHQNGEVNHDKIHKEFTNLSLDLRRAEGKPFVLSEDGRMIAVCVNSKGATIAFGKICLKIPEGALKKEEILFIYNLGYRNTPGELSLCPEVYCGPPGLKFEMYVTLSIDLFGNIPIRDTTQRHHVYCKENRKEWMKIGDVGGTSFIKNNRSYTLVNHFTIFKVVLDQTNDDCTEYQQCQLVEVHPRVNSVYPREEIIVEFRKVLNFNSISDSTSVGYFYIFPATHLHISIDNLKVPIYNFSKNLLNENCPAISHSIIPGTSRMPSHIKCHVDNYCLKLSLHDSWNRTKKEPQTNVNKENIQILCQLIEKEKTPDFENWLFEWSEGEEKDIERAVTKYLAMNDNDFRKLYHPFINFGMNRAADEILKLPNYNLSRRSLPPVSGPTLLEASFCGVLSRTIKIPDEKSGPKAMSYFTEDDEEGRENVVSRVQEEEKKEAMGGKLWLEESMSGEPEEEVEEPNGWKQEVKGKDAVGEHVQEEEKVMSGKEEVNEEETIGRAIEVKVEENEVIEEYTRIETNDQPTQNGPLYKNINEVPTETEENNNVSYNQK